MALKVGLAMVTGWTAEAFGTTHPTHPAANVLLDQYPYRTARRLTSASSWLVQVYGPVTNIDAILFNNVNFPTVDITAAGGSMTAHNGQAIGMDTRVDRRKALVLLGGTANSLGLFCTGTTAVYEIGSLTLVQTLTTLSDDPSFPVRYTQRQARTEIRFSSGGREVQSEGPSFLEYTIQSGVWTKDSGVITQLHAIQNHGFNPLVIYENLGNTSHAYLMRRVDDMDVEQFVNTYSATLKFEEVI